MEVYGNLESVKKSISEAFTREIAAVKKDASQKEAAIALDAKKTVEAWKAGALASAKEEAEQAYFKTKSEALRNAKRAYEQEREELIDRVFDEALKEAPKIAHSKRYVDMVRDGLQKGMELVADSAYYEKELGKVRVEKGMIGVKAVQGKVTHDFSLDGMIRARKDELRHKVAGVLFG